MKNQYGASSLVLLFATAIGILLLWELSQYISLYTPSGGNGPNDGSPGTNQPICKSGESGNCNDSNDQFLLTE